MKLAWSATFAIMGACLAQSACHPHNTDDPSTNLDAAIGAGSGPVPGGPDAYAAMDARVSERILGPPPEVSASRREWPLPNRDYAATRATFDSRLTAANIGGLTKAWSFALPGGGSFGAATSSALVLNGVVYYVDMQSNVFALDAKTGLQRWTKQYKTVASGPNGVAVGWGKVFVPSSDHSFVALDMNTGAELWAAPLALPKNAGLGIAPIAYDGLVYLSTVPVTGNSDYLGGVNGTFYALDQETGSIVWSFATVADATLWGHPDLNSGGGAWYPPTIDVIGGLMYWGVGNAAAYPGTKDYPNGSSRPGANLYTSSVVALDRRTGTLAWYYQDRPHDLFDLDFQNPPIPVSLLSDAGVTRHLVIGSGKTGAVAALDANLDGGLLWRSAVGKHQNDGLQEVPDAGVVVFPGDLGGVETPLAYAEGTVYVPVCNQGRQFFPTRRGSLDDQGTGELIALDVADGSVRWRHVLPAQAYGSVTVVNDLVLIPTIDGTIYAFERSAGAEVWRYQSQIGINAPISVVDDMLIIPTGSGIGVPALLALQLP